MRHRVHGRRLNRDSAHRKALRQNLVADLLCYEKVVTTQAKARTLRPAAEKMITLAKRGINNGKSDSAAEVHARRLAAARLPRYRVVETEEAYEEVDVIQQLFGEIAPRYMDRNGGYTRMIKLGKRNGDNADMAIVMLVEGDESESEE